MNKSHTNWQYPCVSGCNRGSDTARGLSVYQKSCARCKAFNQVIAKLLAKRVQDAQLASKQAAANRLAAQQVTNIPTQPMVPQAFSSMCTNSDAPDTPIDSFQSDIPVDPIELPAPSLGCG